MEQGTGTRPANDDDNRTPYRWPGPKGRGQYENWYAVVQHPEIPFAFWFRYTLLQQTSGPAEARLWAIVTDEDKPERRVVTTQRFSLDQVELDTARFGIRLGEAGYFCNGLARGRLDSPIGEIAWDLSFTPSGDTYQMIASPLVNRFLLKTKHIMPNCDALAQGQVQIGETSVELRDAPLGQGHTFGPKMASRWFWGSCPRFDGDPSCSFEGLANQKGMSFQLTLDGVRHPFNTVRHLKGRGFGLLGGGTRFEDKLGELRFSARDKGLAIEGRFSAGEEPFHLVRYLDTDGELLYNCHQSRGSLEVDITYADGRRRALRSTGRSAVEFVERHPHGRDEASFLPRFDGR